MSTLRVTNLQSAAGTQNVTQDRLYRGAATAWVNFNGTGTVAIRDSYNVSSITDNGVGDYTVNFQTALANANYCFTGASGGSANTSNGATYSNDQSSAKTTSSFRIAAISVAGAFVDTPQIHVAIFGGY